MTMLAVVILLGAFALLSAARAISEQAPGKDEVHGNMDKVEHGPYNIVNCGTKNSSKITASLDNLASYLVPAIHDAGKGSESSKSPSPAYSTFFKDTSSSSYVSSILTNVSTGPPMYPSNYYSNGAPILSCLQSQGQMFYRNATTEERTDAFNPCQEDPNLASYIVTGTAFVIICPSFFTSTPSLPAQSPGYSTAVPVPKPSVGASDCLNVSKTTNEFSGDGTTLTAFAPWLLLEELARYYINATNEELEGPGVETYDVNRCVGLSSKRAVQNAHSFVYYVASKSTPALCRRRKL